MHKIPLLIPFGFIHGLPSGNLNGNFPASHVRLPEAMLFHSYFDPIRILCPFLVPIGSMYAIYGNIHHQYTPNVSIYTIRGSYGVWICFLKNNATDPVRNATPSISAVCKKAMIASQGRYHHVETYPNLKVSNCWFNIYIYIHNVLMYHDMIYLHDE